MSTLTAGMASSHAATVVDPSKWDKGRAANRENYARRYGTEPAYHPKALQETMDVRESRYKYIRNFMPDRPYTQFNNYIETSYPTLGVMKELHKAGKLNATQSLFMAPRKPEVELYDIEADPHEVNNLAGTPAHKKAQSELGAKLDKWLVDIDDKGRFPEDPKAAEL